MICTNFYFLTENPREKQEPKTKRSCRTIKKGKEEIDVKISTVSHGNCKRTDFSVFSYVRLLCLVLIIEMASTEDVDNMPGSLDLIKRCKPKYVYVDKMYLTCDSPSAYYAYEPDQNSYKGSTRCKYGDTGKLFVYFSLSNNFGWIGVDVSIDVGYMNSYISVKSATDLCSLGSLKVASDDDRMACPESGYYQLYWSFTIPQIGNDEQLQYYPDIRIKFFNQSDSRTLGCAGFGTAATVDQHRKIQRRGEWALGVSLAIFFFTFGFCLLTVYRRKKEVEQDLEGRELHRYYYYARHKITGELVPVGTNREEQAKHHHESYHEKTQKQILQATPGSMDDADLQTPWR